MQGQLRHQDLTVTIDTSCGHCSRPMQFTIDSDMVIGIPADGAEPLVFLPDVNWETFAEPTIIDTY